MSSYSQAYKSSRSRKGKQRADVVSSAGATKAGPSTAITCTKKGTPDPGIFSTRDSHTVHTSPSFERGRPSTSRGDIPLEAMSAQVTGAGGQGEASYSREGSQNSGPWVTSGSDEAGEGPASASPARRPGRAHPADTTWSEAYVAVAESFHHSDDPEYWANKRAREEFEAARERRRERERRRDARPSSPDACGGCVLF